MKSSASLAAHADMSPAVDDRLSADIDMMGGLLASVANRHDKESVAWALVIALDKFERIRKEQGLRLHFSPEQRDDLLAGLVTARVGVEVFLFGKDRDDAADMIRAFQRLASYFARDPATRKLPDGRFEDLIALVRIGHNTVRNIELRADVAERARRRALPTLDALDKDGAA